MPFPPTKSPVNSVYLLIKKTTEKMSPFTFDSTGERFLISIDKNYINKGTLMLLLERFRIEHLAQKINLGEEVEELGEEIKKDWWDKNKSRFISEE